MNVTQETQSKIDGLQAEIELLRARLEEAEGTIEAIRTGAVDALVIAGAQGDQIFTLQGADQVFRLLVETINEGAATLTHDGMILYANRYLAQMLGVPLESLPGTQLAALLPAKERPRFQAMLQLATEAGSRDELTFKNATETIPVMLSLTPFHNPEVGGICLVATDLTQQKVNEEIVASERLARSILEQVGEVIVVLDAKGKIIRASQQTWNLAGQNPLYRSFDSIFPLTLTYPGGETTGFSLAEVVKGATYQNVMAELRLPEKVHYLLFNAVPMLKQESEEAPGVIVTMVDITRQRQEEFDQRFLAHLGQLIQSEDDPDVMLSQVISATGDYFRASRTLFCEVHTDKELCILHADYHPGLSPLAHKISLSSLGMETVQELRSGQAVILQDVSSDPRTATLFSSPAWPENLRAFIAVPILQEGEWTAVLAVSSNRSGAWSTEDIPLLQAVADRIWPAYEKLRLSASLRESEEAVRNYALDLEKSNQELKNFTSIISHDLQEPLRKVLAFGEQLKRKYASSLDEEGIDYIGRMQNASVRMQRMIDDLLTYSRLSTSERRFKAVDLNQVAQEVLEDLETRISQTRGSVELSALPVIQGDEVQMRQLFQNIIGNALKFHKEEVPPRVKVWSLMPDKGQTEIYISDNGIGFSMEHLERIFQPFQRLHGRNEYEGNGIGLAICRKITERHNGRITAQSDPGKGTTFVISLPVNGFPSDEEDTRGSIQLA